MLVPWFSDDILVGDSRTRLHERWYTVGMPSDDTAVASVANHPQPALPVPSPDVQLPVTSDASTVIGDAGVAALADNLAYTLTAGQALERFSAARRKVPSLRTIQRYCIEGHLAAQKIRTTYGSEWLINEEALATLIQSEPEIAVASDANQPQVATSATPTPATPIFQVPVTTASGVADVAEADEMATPTGERRRISDVLIQNAKLVAEVEGRDAIIAELKEDRNFLREEVREARKTRDDVKNIAERMLDTLKTMAIGRLASAAVPPDPVEAEIIRRQEGQI